MPSRARRSFCPVACTLDVLGDRWSLLVVRDLMRGKKRYAEFLESPEGIPTNILADRLKRLTAKGVIRSRRYSKHPPRVEYELTPKGEELRPILRAMVEWGVRHAGGRTPPAAACRYSRFAWERVGFDAVKPRPKAEGAPLNPPSTPNEREPKV